MSSRRASPRGGAFQRLRELLRPLGPHRWIRKIGITIAIVLGVMVVGYLGIGNAFLALDGVPWLIDREASGVHIEYGSAWTWWPGRVKLRDFRLAFQNDDIEFDIELDRADADISLLQLFHKRFYASSVVGQGLVYRMRLTRDPRALEDEESNAALPRIAGFGDLPVRKFTVPRPPPPPDHYNLWAVQIDHIDCSLSEVWIEQVRVTGIGHVRGGFELVPMRYGRIHDVVASLEEGRVDRGNVVIGENVHQLLEANIAYFDAEHDGAESMLRNLDAVLRGGALVHSAEIVDAIPFFRDRGLSFEDGVGEAHARVAFEKGKLTRGSVIRVDNSNIEAAAKGIEFAASQGTWVQLTGRTEGIDLDMRAPSLNLIPRALPAAAIHSENVSAHAHFRADPTLLEIGFEAVSLDVPASNMSLAALDGQLGPVRVDKGAGFARATATIDNQGATTGELNLAIFGLTTHGGRARVSGEARAKLSLSSPNIGDLHFDLAKSELDVDKVDVRVGDAHPPSWSGHTDIEKGTVEFGKQGPTFDLRVHGAFQDSSPLLAVFRGEELVPGFAANLLTMKGLQVNADVRKSERAIDVDIHEAKGEGGSVEGIFIGGDNVLRGAFRLHAGILTAGVSFREHGFALQLIPTAEWLNDERKELRATIPAKHATAARAMR